MPPKIPLMKNTFLEEASTKQALADFILGAARLSMGEKCLEFETAFAKFQDRTYAVLFNSGASANLALIQAYKNLSRLKAQDLVGFSAVTWSTNVMPLIQLGLTPVPIDCDPQTLNCMSHQLEKVLTSKRLKAFFLTNVLGLTGDLDQIKKVCEKHQVLLLEDNCESLGSQLASGFAGNFGEAATFSFFVGHHMSTIEGGCVVTDDPDLDAMLRVVRANGWDRNLSAERQKELRTQYGIDDFQAKYSFYDLGYNLRPTEITGFLGLKQLDYLKKSFENRQKNYQTLKAVMNQNEDFFSLQADHLKFVSNFAFPIICKTPALKQKYLDRLVKAGVEVRPLIAGNMTRQPFYQKYFPGEYDLPGADLVHENGFYFGNHPDLSDKELDVIKNCLLSL